MSREHEFNPENLTYGSDTPQTRERLRELMLFIADRCEDDSNFGVTKLNKILYYCDFLAFAKLGEPITGISYNKLPFGPVPTAAQIVRDKMRQDGEIVITHEGSVSFRLSRVVPVREADLCLFTGPQVALIDSVIEAVGDANARLLTDITHGNAWKVLSYNDIVPYEFVFISDTPYTEADIARAEELVAAGEIED